MGPVRGLTGAARAARAALPARARRRGLVLAACVSPGPAFAGACEALRPGWDGAPVTAFGEALHLFSAPPALILLGGTIIALRFRSQWGGLAVTVLWSALVWFIVFGPDPSGDRRAAALEGCMGSPALFIAIVAAISVATILYTAPVRGRSSD